MKQILVVDDDVAVRSAFEFALDDTPVQVVVASSGEEGLTKFEAGRFDLVITDLKMPGMNGIELIDEIRKLDSQVPLRVITAFAEEFLKELERATQEGRNFDLIRKPLERDDIRAVVSAVCGMDLDAPGSGDAAAPVADKYLLRLYVTGETPNSVLALKNIERICEDQLAGLYTLETHDIFKVPQLAADDRIIATPTLIRQLPAPIRRIIGDLSDREKVLLGLDLKKE